MGLCGSQQLKASDVIGAGASEINSHFYIQGVCFSKAGGDRLLTTLHLLRCDYFLLTTLNFLFTYTNILSIFFELLVGKSETFLLMLLKSAYIKWDFVMSLLFK